MLNKKSKDSNIYYYGPERKYVSTLTQSKLFSNSSNKYSESPEENESHMSIIKKSKSRTKEGPKSPKDQGISRALFKEDKSSAQKSREHAYTTNILKFAM